MTRPLRLHPDRLFASDPVQRDIARTLYAAVADLPIVSPHGHTDPHWFATDAAWENAAELLLTGQHRDDQAETLLFRLLRGAGVRVVSTTTSHDLAEVQRKWGCENRTQVAVWADRAGLIAHD